MHADYSWSPVELLDNGLDIISMSPEVPENNSSLLPGVFYPSTSAFPPCEMPSVSRSSNLSSFDSVSTPYQYLSDLGPDVDAEFNTPPSLSVADGQLIAAQTSLMSSATISDDEYTKIYEAFIQLSEPSSHSGHSSQLYPLQSASSSSCPAQSSNLESDAQDKFAVNKEYIPFFSHFRRDHEGSKSTKGTRVGTNGADEEVTSFVNDSADAEKDHRLPSLIRTASPQPRTFTKLKAKISTQGDTPTINPNPHISPPDMTSGMHDVKHPSLPIHLSREILKRKVNDSIRKADQMTSSLVLQSVKKETQITKRRLPDQKVKVSAATITYHVFHSKGYKFKCPLCHEDRITRKSRSDFIRHIRSHGEASYQCERCGTSLSRRDALKRHQGSNICAPS
ncbi:hypothetical protein C0993_000375 [Termitomyces sp. T159_Od127]|nr:hypothetical protein C0993_000375 [Termitomyces sp. T159_Od127]